jgi:arylsulfatase A-like enzyme
MGMKTRGLPAIVAMIALVGTLVAGLVSGSARAFSDVLATSTPAKTATPRKSPTPAHPPTATPVKQTLPTPDRYVVMIVSDGARYDEWDLAHMPNLAALVKRGTTFTQATVGQLPSITESSHATLGTGVYPYRHTILGDNWRLPGQNKMSPDLLNASLDRTGYIENLIRQQKVPTLASVIHRRFPQGKVVTLSGHKVYAATAMGPQADYVAFGMTNAKGQFAPATTPSQAPDSSILGARALALKAYPRTAGLEDHWTTSVAQQFVQRYRPRLLMINYPEIDVAGHTYGTDPKYIGPIMQGLDKDIGQLEAVYKKLGILSKTDFIITSDHGMAPASHIVDIGQVQKVITGAGATYLSVGHGDFCPIYLNDPSKIPAVAQALVNARIPYVRAVYMKNAQGQYVLASPQSVFGGDAGLQQAYADLLSTYNNVSSADIVLLYDENTITMTPQYAKVGRKGDHEGATWGAQHIGLFIAGPGIKQGYVSSYPARLVDLPMTVAALYTARPKRMDGVPLTDAMTSPASWMTAASRAVQPQRVADTAALAGQLQLPLSNAPSPPGTPAKR